MKIQSKKLKKAVKDFTKDMEDRLAEKEKAGYCGWDSSSVNGCTKANLIEAITEDVRLLNMNTTTKLCCAK